MSSAEDDRDEDSDNHTGWDEINQSVDRSYDEQGELQDESMDDQEYSEEIQKDCLENFAQVDFIMEPDVFTTLQRYFKAGGAPEQVVELLSDGYTAVAQTANLLAEWLIQAGVDIKEVQEIVESHLKDMLVKHFDPAKADQIFSEEGETPSWLADMIEHSTWRKLIYQLAASYPDCLMLNFTIKLICDSGYEGEITSDATASQQIEVFSKVIKTKIAKYLQGGEVVLKQELPSFASMVSHGEHTFLFSQMMLHTLGQENKGGSNVRRLSQEVQCFAKKKGFDCTPISLALLGAAAYPRACQALSSMLSRQALNPADITVLYKMFSSNDPPPVELLRSPQFLDLFIQSLFKPSQKINQEHRQKYIFLLAYAVSVTETWRKGSRKNIGKDELKSTMSALEHTTELISLNKGSSELVADVGLLFSCLKIPVVSMGLLLWVDHTVSNPSYFKLNTDHTPFHLVLLDEISSKQQLLLPPVLQLLIRLFETNYIDLDVLVQLELKKTLLDRMVHLMSCGSVLPVVSYIVNCWRRCDTDISLIRHFIIEVLDIISPPYTNDFINLIMPLIENEDVTGSIRTKDDNDPVAEFLMYCCVNQVR